MSSSIKFSIGDYTDIGGCKENQDAMVRYEDEKIIIISIIDGHGSNGKKVATFCKIELENMIALSMEEILSEPTNFLSEIFSIIHRSLALNIIREKNELGLVCRWEPSGALLIKKSYADVWEPIMSGGATMTISILFKDTLKLYVANVGDSEAMLCSVKPILQNNDLVDINIETEAKAESETELPDRLNYIMITGNHSPNNKKEYERIQLDPTIIKKPLFIYDALIKTNGSSNGGNIYDTSKTDAVMLVPSNNNIYCKNVRKEYATYLSLPEDELPTKCNLAVCRSVGDFPMVPYGCSSIPTIRVIDCQTILQRYEETDEKPMLCLLVSSDGLWDNWNYQDVQEFMMHSTCLNAVSIYHPNGTQRVITSLMERNKLYGTQHFGNNSDNATSIGLYIIRG